MSQLPILLHRVQSAKLNQRNHSLQKMENKFMVAGRKTVNMNGKASGSSVVDRWWAMQVKRFFEIWLPLLAPFPLCYNQISNMTNVLIRYKWHYLKYLRSCLLNFHACTSSQLLTFKQFQIREEGNLHTIYTLRQIICLAVSRNFSPPRPAWAIYFINNEWMVIRSRLCTDYL